MIGEGLKSEGWIEIYEKLGGVGKVKTVPQPNFPVNRSIFIVCHALSSFDK